MKVALKISIVLLMLTASKSFAQKLNVGITFQYHVLKQVSVDADVIQGNNSYSIYYVTDNRWKFFSAGQSIVVGTVAQMDYKKVYAAIEPSFNLNTYTYTVGYATSPTKNEAITFQSLFFQLDFPVYLGYQFQSSRIFRYSFFAGGVIAVPYVGEEDIKSKLADDPKYEYFGATDMRNVLYDGKPYLNSLVGVCIHFASLGKVDIRYQHRLGSPSPHYDVTFNTIGASLTYYLPLNLLRKKIYYED